MEQYIGTKIVEAEPEALRYKNEAGVEMCEEGYKVRYQDGYESWSPKGVFEEAYRKTDGMTFGLALEAMKKGKGARLPRWKPDVVIRAQYPDKNSKMTAPYLYAESRYGRVPWKETMIELFSDEWEIVD